MFLLLHHIIHNTALTDVLIIGAGVIGTSIAYHLAQRKVTTAVVEAGDLAAGSSGACDGLVFLQSKKPGVHLDLALASRDKFTRLAEDLPYPIEFEPCGGLVVIEDQTQLEAMRRFVDRQVQGGLEVELIDARQTRELEPNLAASVCGATWSELDGQVNPIALTHALALGAKEQGTEFHLRTRVTGLSSGSGQTWEVQTDKGVFQAQCVVLAAGVWTPALGTMLGLHIPIRPRKGQLLVTQPSRPVIHHPMLSATYIAAKFDPDLAREQGQGVSMEQTAHGTLLLGSTREFAGFDRTTTWEGLTSITRRCAGLLPVLRRMHIIRSFAGLRPYTPDGLPILGSTCLDNVFIAAGHEGDGIALAPITGELMAQRICEGKTDISLEAFGAER